MAAVSALVISPTVVGRQGASAIVGGSEAGHAYPFTGSLIRPSDSPRPDGHVCGVTLIAPQWVVTASHCARNDQDLEVGYPADWSVRLGSTRVTSGGELIDVSMYVRRANGPLADIFGKDIALLKLRRPAKATPVAMASATPAPGTAARILGWGMTCNDAAPACYPAKLREARTRVQPSSTCQVSDADLCIGALDGSIDPTNMDSGGPALARNGKRWTLLGVVSGGGDSGPGIYTNVAAFRSWITQTIHAKRPSLVGAVSVDGRCSGAIVRGPTSRPDDPALLLTNGHCVAGDRPAPGSAVTGRPEAVSATVRRADGSTVGVQTAMLAYATMTGTDIALYRLTRTFAQLEAEKVKVFDLATTRASAADPLSLVSGNRGHTWSCAVGGLVPELREGGYSLTNSIYEREDCTAGSGDSGSPLLDPRSGKIVGVHNTSNGLGGVCTDDNPCEIDQYGRTSVHIGRGYGQQVDMIPGCLGPRSTLVLTTSGCRLTRPK